MEPIRILIVDDMEAHRRRLERIIKTEESFSLVASACSGSEAVDLAIANQPDIILMDIEMEDQLAGIKAASAINQRLPEAKIIILTIHQDSNIIFAAFQTGIVDYVMKSSKQEEIIDAIYAAYNNRSPIRPVIAEKIRHEFARIKRAEDNFPHIFKIMTTLTPSEIEILRLLCGGKKRKEIAKERSVELETIKKQITNILKKFDKKSTREVVRTIKELGIFEMINQIS
ncbi:response regulator transcription factor [Metabacillus arenae]|uniref:Response regulator transcription factor n=1 Tax=Metabacillus arenae TaxID=2771434 RepID=A0A926RZH0_9BACI|nr:response regulator transcription factor [Metabacillus arenae]MBD1382247.1 response regulator transcription factor [Metabacillus arenae]